MIHIIGTCHKTQIWTDLVKGRALGAAPRSKVEAFQKYLADAAVSVGALAIGEEMSEDRILEYGHNAICIGQYVARSLNIAHFFCEPDRNERRRLGLLAGNEMVEHARGIASKIGRTFDEVHRQEVRKQFAVREAFWVARLASVNLETNSVVFVCGAEHCETLPETLTQRGLEFQIHCPDWTMLSEIRCPCCF